MRRVTTALTQRVHRAATACAESKAPSRCHLRRCQGHLAFCGGAIVVGVWPRDVIEDEYVELQLRYCAPRRLVCTIVSVFLLSVHISPSRQ